MASASRRATGTVPKWAQRPTDVARVLVPGLNLHVEVGQPPVAGLAERDPAARGPPGVLLCEEPGEQLLGLALGGRGPREVDALPGHRVAADVDTDLVDASALTDAAAAPP